MSFSTAMQLTYADNGRKESVLDIIEQISALEDNFLTTLPKSKAVNTVHSYMTETLRTAQSRATVEGDDAAFIQTTTPTRNTNLTQIVGIPFVVSGTQMAVEHYGFEDLFAHESSKAMMDWKNAAEFDLVRAALTSGSSGTAPKMNGIIASITTNATSHTSGTVFSESIMNGLFQLTWDNSNGEVATDIYVGSLMKRKISGFAGRSGSSTISRDMTTAVNAIDYYISDFGEHRVHLHRFVFQSGDATQRFLAVRPEKFAVAYLTNREPKLERLSKTGDSEKAQVIGELTLEARNEKTAVYSNGFLLT